MPPQSAANLESFRHEIELGQHQLTSPRAIQSIFANAAERDVLMAFEDLINEHHKIQVVGEDQLRVVHYTDIPSVISMLSIGVTDARNEEPDPPPYGYLRMYSTVGSNDPGEGAYLHRFLTNEIWEEHASEAAAKIETETSHYAYVASFIRPNDPGFTQDAADNLVFWRSYGREGTGCSLTMPAPRQGLRSVTYGQDKARNASQRLTQEIGRLWETAENIKNEVGVSLAPLTEAINLRVDNVRYLYKSNAYSYEQECRIVETPTTIKDTAMKPLFEHSGPPGQERTKRYINNPVLTMDRLLVSGSTITLGPRVPNPMDTKEYIEHLLERAGLPGPTVKHSKIEYRNSTNL